MEKRSFYRINYPASARPALLLGGKSHPVLDLSESGLKYEHPEGGRPADGSALSGTIVFADQEKLDVEGTVLRTVGTAVVVSLTRGVPFAKIVSEQRRFLKTPPDL